MAALRKLAAAAATTTALLAAPRARAEEAAPDEAQAAELRAKVLALAAAQRERTDWEARRLHQLMRAVDEEHSRERARESIDAVRHDRQAERIEAGRVAVGVDRYLRNLRGEPINRVSQQRSPVDLDQRLVAASEAPRPPASQDDAEDGHSALEIEQGATQSASGQRNAHSSSGRKVAFLVMRHLAGIRLHPADHPPHPRRR